GVSMPHGSAAPALPPPHPHFRRSGRRRPMLALALLLAVTLAGCSTIAGTPSASSPAAAAPAASSITIPGASTSESPDPAASSRGMPGPATPGSPSPLPDGPIAEALPADAAAPSPGWLVLVYQA